MNLFGLFFLLSYKYVLEQTKSWKGQVIAIYGSDCELVGRLHQILEMSANLY